MKHFILVVVLLLTPIQVAKAESDISVGTTLHIIRIPDGGSLDEALALSNEWRARVLDQMPQFKRVDYLLQEKEEGVYHLLVVREMHPESANMGSKSIGQAIADGFESAEERDQFFQNLGRYINGAENIVENYELVSRPHGHK